MFESIDRILAASSPYNVEYHSSHDDVITNFCDETIPARAVT
jgi:hypothetical protein